MRAARTHGKRVSHQPSTQKHSEDGLNFGWHAHSAISESIARVDNKAAIVLSLGGVLLGYLVALSSLDPTLANLHGWRDAVQKTGLVITMLGVLSAAMVVSPHLSRRRVRRGRESGIMYFGHLRHWTAQELAVRLDALTAPEVLEQLADQMVAVSKISWFKHSLLQVSVATLAVGVGMTALSALHL